MANTAILLTRNRACPEFLHSLGRKRTDTCRLGQDENRPGGNCGRFGSPYPVPAVLVTRSAARDRTSSRGRDDPDRTNDALNYAGGGLDDIATPSVTMQR